MYQHKNTVINCYAYLTILGKNLFSNMENFRVNVMALHCSHYNVLFSYTLCSRDLAQEADETGSGENAKKHHGMYNYMV